MKLLRSALVPFCTSLLVAAMACGPAASGDDDDDDVIDESSDVDAPGNPNCSTPIPEICDNGVDDDCDNIGDCDDADCSSNAACSNPNCGTLEEVAGSLALPDGACDEDETIPCAASRARSTSRASARARR